MNRNIFRLIFSSVLMMCCPVMANAQIGVRGGTLVKDDTGNKI